jgi:hypothetical protein
MNSSLYKGLNFDSSGLPMVDCQTEGANPGYRDMGTAIVVFTADLVELSSFINSLN